MKRAIIIGAGRISLSHLPHIINHPNIKLVAIVEPSLLTRLVISRLTKIKVVKSIDEINYENYDCAFVLTPPSSHYMISKKLLNEDKHLFIEKPLSLDPDQSAELLSIAKKKNLTLSVGYVYRFHPIYMKLKKILLDEKYGYLKESRISMTGNVVSKSTPTSWRNTGIGSGCLYDYGCHIIDLSFYLYGEPDSARCISKEELFQENVIDKFEAEFTFKNLDSFYSRIYCNWADKTVRKASINIELNTTKNKIYCDGQKIQIIGETNKIISIKDLDTNVDYYLRGEEFQLQLESFINNVNCDAHDYTNAEQAVTCDEYIQNIYLQKI